MLKDIVKESFKQERGTIHQYYEVNQHDVKVAFGDFNYRVVPEFYDLEKTAALINAKDFKQLSQRDEFYCMRGKDEVLKTFNEGPILFAPTSRYYIGRSDYNYQYVPSYTDRVFWSTRKLEEADSIRLVHYNRAELNQSDHRPILAVLQAQVKTHDKQKQAKYRNQLAE